MNVQRIPESTAHPPQPGRMPGPPAAPPRAPHRMPGPPAPQPGNPPPFRPPPNPNVQRAPATMSTTFDRSMLQRSGSFLAVATTAGEKHAISVKPHALLQPPSF